ncbi:Hypothetical_protein [Hexamita inflata]|uniref:Hypothetical_protein n=1 Tax=Hexamita inflata TaxID=28002 RepID=A0ABP1JE78_9EUKA
MHTPKVDTYEYSPAKQKQYTERMVVRHIETFRAVGRASDQINRDAAGERYEPISEEERIIQNNIHFPQNKPIAEIQLTTSQDKVQYVTLCVWSVLIKIILILELLQILIIVNQKYYISCISTNIQK